MPSLNQTPSSERIRITIFGRRNSGKSTLINALTGQNLAITSDVAGTTTDPVSKAMEILPLGPVVLTDTAGLDDEGELGRMRVEKSLSELNRTDFALVVIDAALGVSAFEQDLLNDISNRKLPHIVVVNKADTADPSTALSYLESLKIAAVAVSALDGSGIGDLKTLLVRHAPQALDETSVLDGLISSGDVVVLVTPIDQAAPKGRMILPQVMTIRDAVDKNAVVVVCRERELHHAIKSLSAPPKLVITDSQVFLKADADTPRESQLTSFSILMARLRGDLTMFVEGAREIDKLKTGSKVLIAEACTHHTQPDDIGSVQIPRWLRQYVGGYLHIDHVNGRDFPKNALDYQLIIQCGSCMLNRREVIWRQQQAKDAGVPMTNYGIALAKLHGILPRALQPFPAALLALLD